MATQKPRKTGTKAVTKRAQRNPRGPKVNTADQLASIANAVTALSCRMTAVESPATVASPSAFATNVVFKADQPSELVGKIRDVSNLVDEVRGDFDRLSGRLAPVRLPQTPHSLGEAGVGASPAPVVPTTPLEDELNDLRRNIRELQRRILTTNDSLVI